MQYNKLDPHARFVLVTAYFLGQFGFRKYNEIVGKYHTIPCLLYFLEIIFNAMQKGFLPFLIPKRSAALPSSKSGLSLNLYTIKYWFTIFYLYLTLIP